MHGRDISALEMLATPVCAMSGCACRVAWSSGPPPEVLAQRSAWNALPLRQRLQWSQTAKDVTVRLSLPQGDPQSLHCVHDTTSFHE